jgi:hypothetical protein
MLAAMTHPLFVCGQLHAPYFIFVRCAARCSDADVLRWFGLSTYCPTNSPRLHGRHAILADDGQWMMIADDWHYTLWHMPTTRPTLQKLARSYDVFAGSVGDCDDSFDFVYYQRGQLVRRYVVDDPDFRGGSVVEITGAQLLGEAAAFGETEQLKIVLSIAASLGIMTNYTEHDVRVYAPPTEPIAPRNG